MNSKNWFKENISTCSFSECNQESEFACQCSESFWCKNHIWIHEISSTATHSVSSLLIDIYDSTKESIMKVLLKERSKLDEMHTKIQGFISENNFSFDKILSTTLNEVISNIILIDQICVELRDTEKIHKFEKNPLLKSMVLGPQDGIRTIKKVLKWNWCFENDDFYISTLNILKSKLIEIQEFENWTLSLETHDRNDHIETISKSLQDEINSRFTLNFEKEKLLTYCCISEKINSSYQEYLEKYQNINRVSKRYIENLIYDTNYLYNIVLRESTGLWTINIESKQKEWKMLPTPDKMGHQTCIVKLPNSELFCFGSANSFSGAAYICDLQSWSIRKYLPYTDPRNHSGGIFYKNAVYIFGGKKKNKNKGYFYRSDCCDVEKFDLKKNIWVKLPPIIVPSHGCSCTIFKNQIFFCGDSNWRLYKYDLLIESCSEIESIEVIMNRSKILFTRNFKLYLLQQNGPIFESGVENEYMFNNIGISNMTYFYSTSIVFIGNIVYFSIYYDQDVSLYQFNLSGGLLKKLPVSHEGQQGLANFLIN